MNKFNNVVVVARKERLKFEGGREFDYLHIIQKFDGKAINMSVSKKEQELFKYLINFDAMEYDKDYVIYGKAQ